MHEAVKTYINPIDGPSDHIPSTYSAASNMDPGAAGQFDEDRDIVSEIKNFPRELISRAKKAITPLPPKYPEGWSREQKRKGRTYLTLDFHRPVMSSRRWIGEGLCNLDEALWRHLTAKMFWYVRRQGSTRNRFHLQKEQMRAWIGNYRYTMASTPFGRVYCFTSVTGFQCEEGLYVEGPAFEILHAVAEDDEGEAEADGLDVNNTYYESLD